MKRFNTTIMAIGAMAVFPAVMPAQLLECQSIMVNTKAVALAAPRSGPLVNFTGSGGQLDPVPLLETNIKIIGIPGHAVCVTVTFSAQVDPVDNYGVYQISIDNVPMAGHAVLSEYGLTTPIVFDAVNQGSFIPLQGSGFLNPANSRMVSYKFFASVMPGTRTIRVRVAGCCSPVPTGITPVFVRAATLVANW